MILKMPIEKEFPTGIQSSVREGNANLESIPVWLFSEVVTPNGILWVVSIDR